ncbi:hypothetical protein ACHQM5_016609 [Ranunculus cassubicifolius]
MERRPHASSTPITTFVQADTKSFRELVQRLTGQSDGGRSQRTAGMKRLHERRSRYTGSKLEIVKPAGPEDVFPPPSKSCRSGYVTSPLGTPSKSFSRLSILEDDQERKMVQSLNTDEEERAINERRFYLYPSPRSGSRYGEPELLSLFPLSSPRSNDQL